MARCACGVETERYCVYHYGFECEECHNKKPMNTTPPDLVYGPRMKRKAEVQTKADK